MISGKAEEMTRFAVSGLINVETTLKIDSFPLAYNPVNYLFFGIQSRVSGVGYNLTRALTTLGHEVRLLSLIGADLPGLMVRQTLAQDGLPADDVLTQTDQTAQSVILYDTTGRRQIHVDLKRIQEATYPEERARAVLAACDWAVLCNINFSRPLLHLAHALGRPIATDVHTIGVLEDAYNADFMAAATVLFMSDESLPETPETWARRVMRRYGPEVLVIGMGARGALLALRSGETHHVPAQSVRPIVNTIGAGDALFAAFLHGYTRTGEALTALERAVLFAGWKIGVASAAEGFLDAAALDALYARFTRQSSAQSDGGNEGRYQNQ